MHEIELLCAASDLCNVADKLRALGLLSLAEQIEHLIATLDVELLLGAVADS